MLALFRSPFCFGLSVAHMMKQASLTLHSLVKQVLTRSLRKWHLTLPVSKCLTLTVALLLTECSPVPAMGRTVPLGATTPVKSSTSSGGKNTRPGFVQLTLTGMPIRLQTRSAMLHTSFRPTVSSSATSLAVIRLCSSTASERPLEWCLTLLRMPRSWMLLQAAQRREDASQTTLRSGNWKALLVMSAM